MSDSSIFKVRLRPQSAFDGLQVIFHATPDLTENRNVNYKPMEPVHLPGAIHMYNNSSSRTFSLQNLKLVSRTPYEASLNLGKINMLRSWAVGRFGAEKEKNTSIANDRNTSSNPNGGKVVTPYDALLTEQNYFGTKRSYQTGVPGVKSKTSDLLGSPPPILLLSAYSKASAQHNLYNIPVAITNISIPYPSDVDYIPTLTGEPFPILMTVGIETIEMHSPQEYEQFNIEDYRVGNLSGF